MEGLGWGEAQGVADPNIYIVQVPFTLSQILRSSQIEMLTGQRGDQIGRDYAPWLIVNSGKIFENCKSSPLLFMVYFFHK
jgi:hypothetical protein